MEDVFWPIGLFFGHLVYFVSIWSIFWPFGIFLAIWYILWEFSIFCGYLVYFSRFGTLYQEKSGNPARIPKIFRLSCDFNSAYQLPSFYDIYAANFYVCAGAHSMKTPLVKTRVTRARRSAGVAAPESQRRSLRAGGKSP
jgi:hypothetical protein